MLLMRKSGELLNLVENQYLQVRMWLFLLRKIGCSVFPSED